jgi:Tfp pilus assembly protein PilF
MPVSLEADAYHNMGLIKITMGQKESGCSDLHKALELGNKAAAEEIKKHCN